MAGKVDFGSISIVEWGVGVGLVVVCIAIVNGLAAAANVDLPSALASAIGAAIGVAAWFSYLLKRNS